MFLIESTDRIFYGISGKLTPYKTDNGEPLHVGDLVELKNNHTAIQMVVEEKGKYFIMGIYSSCNNETGVVQNWSVKLKKKYYEVSLEDSFDSDDCLVLTFINESYL